MASKMLWGHPEDKKYKGPGIYVFISPSGKRYVGQSINIHTRMRGHRRSIRLKKKNGKWKYDHHWAKAARKYGWGKLKLFVLQKIYSDDPNLKDMLNKWETHWIRWFRSNEKKYGYNSNEGGDSRCHSAETKQKMRVAQTGCKHTPETKIKMSASQKGNKNALGNKHSAKTKAKISAAHKGHTRNIGRKLSAQTKAKIGAANKGKKPRLGKKHSAETKAKISATKKGKNVPKRYKAIIAIFPNGEEKKFKSNKHASNEMTTKDKKFPTSCISRCCMEKYVKTTHHGIKFRFA